MVAQDIYTVRIYSPQNVLLRVIRNVQSARYRLAENEVGDADITIPWVTNDIPLLLAPPNHIELYRNSIFVYGGIIRRQNARQEGKVPTYTVSGPSYMQWLADIRMRPTTGTGDIVYVSAHLDDRMKDIVRTQVLDTNNKFVVASDSGLSAVSDVYTATAYETVLETLQAIATRAGDTSFDIIRDADDVLRFRTWTPSRGPDKSKGTASPVLFDLRGGNLLNAEWTRDANAVVNAMWGGGPGDKAARYVYPAGDALLDSASIADWGRIEGFIDAGAETTTAVDKKTQEELDKVSTADESVNFKISQFGRYTLGVDFDFGTKVTVIWTPILEFTDTIKGMEVRLDSGMKLAQVDINVGDTLTGNAQTRASIYLGRFMRQMRRTISIQTRH